MIPTCEELIAKTAALTRPPVAFEARWDGDTSGWMIDLVALLTSGSEAGYEGAHLWTARIEDMRLFNGQVPPWTEAAMIAERGRALAEEFDVPFYFPSPHHPEEDCPRWWERERAVPCRACGIPLYQEDDCPWKRCCSFCHLNERAAGAATPFHVETKATRWWEFWR